MIKVENLRAEGFNTAFRGMRNPLDSWHKADSYYGVVDTAWDENDWEIATTWADNELKIRNLDWEENVEEWDKLREEYDEWLLKQGILYRNKEVNTAEVFFIGPNDLSLAQRLIAAGPEHAKFLRQINVSIDITAPFYWWKEFDTYKIGTTANSCSTMHTIHKKPFTLEDFAHDHVYSTMGETYEALDWLEDTIKILNDYRELYLETKNKIYWYSIIQMLPTSYLQKRTVTMNYAVLRNIIKQRQHHKLDEWNQFIEAMKELPYAEELIFYGLENKEEIKWQ